MNRTKIYAAVAAGVATVGAGFTVGAVTSTSAKPEPVQVLSPAGVTAEPTTTVVTTAPVTNTTTTAVLAVTVPAITSSDTTTTAAAPVVVAPPPTTTVTPETTVVAPSTTIVCVGPDGGVLPANDPKVVHCNT